MESSGSGTYFTQLGEGEGPANQIGSACDINGTCTVHCQNIKLPKGIATQCTSSHDSFMIKLGHQT